MVDISFFQHLKNVVPLTSGLIVSDESDVIQIVFPL